MNLITGGGLMVFFGVIVAAGTVIHLWPLFLVILAVVLIAMVAAKPRTSALDRAKREYIATGKLPWDES